MKFISIANGQLYIGGLRISKKATAAAAGVLGVGVMYLQGAITGADAVKDVLVLVGAYMGIQGVVDFGKTRP